MALGTARLSRRTLRPPSLPPASAARALTCSPRRPGRPPRRFPSRQGRGVAAAAAAVGQASGGSRGLPGCPSRSTGRGGDKTAARRPAQSPPSSPPHRPPNRRGDGGDTEPGAGSNGGPRPPPPASAPPPRPPAAATRTLESASPTPPAPSAPPLPTRRRGGGCGGTASHRRACQTRAGYLYPAGPRRPLPAPARPTCFRGRLESRPPCSPPTSPKPAFSGKDSRHLSRFLLGASPACSRLRPGPGTGAGAPKRGLARGGQRGRACTCSGRRPRRHSYTLAPLGGPPRARAVTPSPSSGLPPFSSRDCSALGQPDSH